jgi:hypothetical protein
VALGFMRLKLMISKNIRIFDFITNTYSSFFFLFFSSLLFMAKNHFFLCQFFNIKIFFNWFKNYKANRIRIKLINVNLSFWYVWRIKPPQLNLLSKTNSCVPRSDLLGRHFPSPLSFSVIFSLIYEHSRTKTW